MVAREPSKNLLKISNRLISKALEDFEQQLIISINVKECKLLRIEEESHEEDPNPTNPRETFSKKKKKIFFQFRGLELEETKPLKLSRAQALVKCWKT